MRTIALAPLMLALGGCAFGEFEDSVETESSPIIGGVESTGFPEVIFLTQGGFACTGTLVGKRLILTAAHCVEGPDGNTGTGGTVRFGNGSPFDDMRSVVRFLPHRQYSFGTVTRFDIAFARLLNDAPEGMAPYNVNLEPITDTDLGLPVRVVGFGASDGEAQTGAGVKREVTLNIDEVTPQHIGFGSPTSNICQGDSGGPTLRLGGSAPTVLAVSSYGGADCRPRSYVARTDAFPEFVAEVLSAWGDGPCSQDGTCNSDCTEFLDPDCDICALDGVCASGCARVDLDCPLSGLTGDTCEGDDGCEGRMCIAAADDPRVKYCSETCDAETPCQVPLSCLEGQCRYQTPTPSAQGSLCDENADCRSQICDAANRICVEPCGGDSDCSSEYACEELGGQKVCTVPVEGGCLGCGFSGGWRHSGGSGILLILLLFGYGAAARRRRRRDS